MQDEKQWLEQESKRLVEESERKLENVRAGELQELRRGKVEALQVLQVSPIFADALLSVCLCICTCDAKYVQYVCKCVCSTALCSKENNAFCFHAYCVAPAKMSNLNDSFMQ